MGQSIGSLVVSLGLDAAEYTRGLEKARRDADRASADMVRAFERAGAFIATAGTTAALGLIAFGKSAIDAADHLNDLSKATGLTVESLGGIGFAASQAGGDLDAIASSIGKLNLTIAKAAGGDAETAAVFQKMGVAIKDAAGATRSADAVFADVANKFKGYAEGPEQAALGNALFGKSYQQVLPLLKDGGQALLDNIEYYKRFSGVTTDTAKQADEFNDKLTKLALVSQSAGRALINDLLPSLNTVAEKLLKAAEKGDLFSQMLAGLGKIANPAVLAGQTAVERLVGLLDKSPKERIAAIGFEIAKLQQQLAKDPGNATLQGMLDKYQRQLGKVLLETSNTRDAAGSAFMLGLKSSGAAFDLPPQPAPRLGGGTGGTKPPVDLTTEADRYLESLQRQVDKTRELTAEEQVRLDVGRGIKGLTDAQADRALDLALQVDASKRLQSQRAAEAEQEKALRAEQEKQASVAAALYEATRTPIEQLQRSLVDYQKLLDAGAISWDTYARAVEKAQDDFDKTVPKVEQVIAVMDKFTEQAAKNVQSALGDTLVKAMDGNFKSIVDGFKDMLKRMVAEALAAKVTSAIFNNAPGKAGTGGGNFLADFLSSFLFGTSAVPVASTGAGTVSGGSGLKLTNSAAANDGRMGIQSVSIGSVGAGVSRGEMQAAISKALAAERAQTARARAEGRA